MKEGKSNTILLTIIGIATLLVAVVGATFAFFSAQINGAESASTIVIESGSGGTSGFSGGEEIIVNAMYPRDEAWVNKKITIEYANESGSGTFNYTLGFVYNSTFNASSLKYTFTAGACSDLTKTTQSACTTAGKTWTSNTTGTSATEVTTPTALATGADKTLSFTGGSFTYPTSGSQTHVYVFRIYFPNTGVNQNSEQEKALYGHITYQEA